MIQPVNMSIMTGTMECDCYLLTITVYQSCDLFRMMDSGIIEKKNTARTREWGREGKLREKLVILLLNCIQDYIPHHHGGIREMCHVSKSLQQLLTQ